MDCSFVLKIMVMKGMVRRRIVNYGGVGTVVGWEGVIVANLIQGVSKKR